ncbi:MAG: hypothetical protein AAB767_02195 [Patescibacteria group bacterium]
MFTNKTNNFLTGTKARMVVFLSSFLIPVAMLSAQTDCTDPTRLCNPIKFPNLSSFLLAIINVVIQYGAILVVFFIVFAGFKFVTAQGNSEKISEARKMLTWVVVGAFVLLGVYVIRAAVCGTIKQLGVTVQCEIVP